MALGHLVPLMARLVSEWVRGRNKYMPGLALPPIPQDRAVRPSHQSGSWPLAY